MISSAKLAIAALLFTSAYSWPGYNYHENKDKIAYQSTQSSGDHHHHEGHDHHHHHKSSSSAAPNDQCWFDTAAVHTNCSDHRDQPDRGIRPAGAHYPDTYTTNWDMYQVFNCVDNPSCSMPPWYPLPPHYPNMLVAHGKTFYDKNYKGGA